MARERQKEIKQRRKRRAENIKLRIAAAKKAK